MPKPQLNVAFFPEGGNRIAGTSQRIAFEATNELGEGVNLMGSLGQQSIVANHLGRGVFSLNSNQDASEKVVFNYKGKSYSFDLPVAQPQGIAIHLNQDQLQLQAVGLNAPALTIAILCRGELRDYQDINLDATGAASLRLNTSKLPTGVNDLVVMTQEGQVLADRLFFVDHHDLNKQLITVEGLKKE